MYGRMGTPDALCIGVQAPVPQSLAASQRHSVWPATKGAHAPYERGAPVTGSVRTRQHRSPTRPGQSELVEHRAAQDATPFWSLTHACAAPQHTEPHT